MSEYLHEAINHAEGNVRDKVPTTHREFFWSLLKRGINGTYVSVQQFHLFRYLYEQMFRYNQRKGINDGDRLDLTVRRIDDKPLTYDQLTGKSKRADSEAF